MEDEEEVMKSGEMKIWKLEKSSTFDLRAEDLHYRIVESQLVYS